MWPSRRLIYFLFSFPGILWFWNSSTCSYSFVVEVMSWLSRVNHLLCGMYWLTTDIVSLRKLIMSGVDLLTDCSQSVFLSKLSGEWGEMRLLFSSIRLFCVRRSLNTRLSDPKRKCRLPSLSSGSPKRTYVTGDWVYSYSVFSCNYYFYLRWKLFYLPCTVELTIGLMAEHTSKYSAL